MIIDRLEDARKYCRLHPGFDAAFDLLTSTPFADLPVGRHEVMQGALYLIHEQAQGQGQDAARLEAHQRYIDVQYIIPGSGAPASDSTAEQFGWRPTAACGKPAVPYDQEKDIMFFDDRPEIWFALPAGHFAVFFPGDAHAPAAGAGLIHKAVVKVAVEW